MTPTQRAAMEAADEAFKTWYYLHGAEWNAAHIKPVWMSAWERAVVAALASPDVPKCITCARQGKIQGCGQDTYCSGCVHGTPWKKDYYQARGELS